MTKLMEREHIDMQMAPRTREIGSRINSMEQELRLGRMAQDTRETTGMERKMDRVF